jgi:starch synthase
MTYDCKSVCPCAYKQFHKFFSFYALGNGRSQTDIPLYLIEHEELFGRDFVYGYGDWEYEDNHEDSPFFVLPCLMQWNGFKWKPDIIHCNDWATVAAIPFL